MRETDNDTLLFFGGHSDALDLYLRLEALLYESFPDVEKRVQKTQISFYDDRVYACASLTPVRRRAERPDPFLTVTFGSDVPIASSRLVCVPIRPNRYTHHAMIGRVADIDSALLGWLRASHDLGRR